MTYLYSETPEFFSELCEEIRLFIDIRRIEKLKTDEFEKDGFFVLHYFVRGEGSVESTARIANDGEIVAEYTYECAAQSGELARKRAEKRAAKISLYRALSGHFGKAMPWGSLTGIRPTKLLRDSQMRLGKAKAQALFLNEFDVSEEKLAFAQRIVDVQQRLLPSGENNIDVYIGIPFCTTRCAYCSFASSTPDVFADAEQLYMDALTDELNILDDLLEGKVVRAVYVGGGTPTAISDENLKKILSIAAKIGADEFTVEAGRPDTITQSKLKLIKQSGAKRISVNAQTLRDDTLSRIGRCHTAQDFFEAYNMARQAGFESINVDLIAGLPGESADDLVNTLEQIMRLEPQNITVHTLAIKRASKFAAQNMDALPSSEDTRDALKKAADMLEKAGYAPYYMYRQKYMKG
ncbi:MAG: coproporphyrinogen dehydrogenase HemZ, partial [Clostridia bacterium]|nr:coproporphyrinogen dehydrogenase HemZ [Clostridia bacterium]